MSRSPGARRRQTSRPTATVRRILRAADGSVLHPGLISRKERKSATWEKVPVGKMWWVSIEVVLASVGPLGLPIGPNLLRHPGATVGKLIDRNGTIGYCHFAERKKLQERERLAMIEGESE